LRGGGKVVLSKEKKELSGLYLTEAEAHKRVRELNRLCMENIMDERKYFACDKERDNLREGIATLKERIATLEGKLYGNSSSTSSNGDTPLHAD
jgi:polyhydroxyalkanoate synthesis regulator phasin